ncbi:MAG: hypothetical protein JSS66_17700 [Armatimonadetes bacterium]|nr:hypothetical protein [Armatimonadota bacterium]
MDVATMEDFKEAWRANNRINLELLALCPDESFEFKPGKGKTIRSNYVHIIGMRRAWIEAKLPKEATAISKMDWKTAGRSEIEHELGTSSQLMEALFERHSLKPGKMSLAVFFAYCVAHEANHRAQIELALRLNGAEPTVAKLYALWEWGKK